ncbi:MAG: HigA family addiction module antitoxin [Sphingomonas sp.]
MHASLAVHPGDWLKTEVVEPYGMTVKGLAAHLGVSRQALSNVLNGHGGLSAEMALRFEKAFGVRADTLLRMQLTHDLARLREHADAIHVDRVAEAA